MKQVLGVLAATAIVIGIAGCSTTTTDTAQTPAPTATTAAPAPTPTPTRPALADLVVTPDGIGPLILRSPVPDESPTTAAVAWHPDACTDGGAWLPNYPDGASAIGDKQSPFVLRAPEQSDPIIFEVVFSPELRTGQGIGVGSSAQDVVAAYPDALVKRSATTDLYVLKGSIGQLVIEVGKKSPIQGWTDDYVGKVVWIQIEQLGGTPFSIANSDVAGACSA